MDIETTVTLDDWLAALRSGEYEQCSTQLHNPLTGGYCCLGVLAKVAGLELSESGKVIIVNGEDEDYRPLRRIIHAITNGTVKDSDCWGWNDSGLYSFPQIADKIESQVKGT